MAAQGIEKMNSYVRYLEQNPKEIHLLFKELLINVTSFFRDNEAFKKIVSPLKNQAFMFLASFFSLLVMVKFLLSLGIAGPFVFGDEQIYFQTAYDFFAKHSFTYNSEKINLIYPLYPLIISPAFFPAFVYKPT